MLIVGNAYKLKPLKTDPLVIVANMLLEIFYKQEYPSQGEKVGFKSSRFEKNKQTNKRPQPCAHTKYIKITTEFNWMDLHFGPNSDLITHFNPAWLISLPFFKFTAVFSRREKMVTQIF